MRIQQSKLSSIECFRFLFMMTIVLWHFVRVNPFYHGYIGVDFFFILSGFLLYKSYSRHHIGAFAYTVNKILRLYPEYILVFVFAFVLKARIWAKGDVLSNLMNTLSEIFLVHSVGIYNGGINPSSWYISVLVVGGGLLYAIVYANKRVAISVICPLIVLLGYTYLFSQGDSLETFSIDGCISQPLLRGMAGMSLGIVLSSFVEVSRNNYDKYRWVIDLLSVLSLVLILIVLFSSAHYDKFALIAFVILILACNVSQSLINKYFSSKIWLRLGGITYEMLLVHAPISWIINYFTKDYSMTLVELWTLALVYMCVVILAAILLKHITKLVIQ